MEIGIDSVAGFDNWLKELPLKEELQVRKRIYAIQYEGHFGDCKYLDEALFELRWKNGRRVYFAKLNDKKIVRVHGVRREANS